MVEVHRIRISSATLKDGHYLPGAWAERYFNENGSGFSYAFFKRVGPLRWKRITQASFDNRS